MSFKFSQKVSLFIILLIPISVGLWIRYKPVEFWLTHKSAFFVENRPIFTGYDSYYFARLAEDYKIGVFKPGGEDPLRFVPDQVQYPDVIPFYSWLFAKLSQIFNKPIENITFWLIPILAVLFVIPLTVLLYKLKSPLGALGASLAGVVSFIYLGRTSLNRLDTDSIIYFSIFAIPLAVYLYSISNGKRVKYLFLVLLSLFVHIFYWGYLHPDLIFVFWITSIVYLVLPNFKGSNPFRERNFWKEIALVTLAFNPIILGIGFFSFLGKINSYIFHFGQPIESNFPNIQLSISELQKFDLATIANITVGSQPLFYLGLFGLLLFAYKRPRESILFLPTLLMGLISLKGASRFAMFLSPLLGLGIGFLLDYLSSEIKRYFQSGFSLLIKPLLGATLVLVLMLTNLKSFYYIPKPIMSPSLAQAFIELGKRTPPDAWIYTWWDYGYAIQYYARRATFHDGGTQFSPKTYFIALGFTSPSPEVGYNVTKTLAVCGKECIEQLLEEGKSAKQIKELFESGKLLKGKNINHPIYWVFTGDLISKFFWISYFGSWNFETLKGNHYPLYQTICIERLPKGIFCPIGGATAIFNPLNMSLVLKKRTYPVKIFAVKTPKELKIYLNEKISNGNAIEKVYTFKENFYIWFLTNREGFYTNFNRMFILRTYNQSLFELVASRFPDYLSYKVR